MSRDVFQRAIDRWRERGVPLLAPASEAEIAVAFRQVGFAVSSDICRLYSLAGGFADYESDGLWSLWSLRRIVEENKEHESQFIWFADYLICSHMYAFRYVDAQNSAVYIDHNISELEPYQIAESVAEFLEKYVRNPEDVEAFDLDVSS